METKIIIFVIIIFLGCKVRNNQLNIDQKSQTLVDTLASDTYYKLNLIDSDKYLIEWGTSKFKNISKDTFEILGTGRLEFNEANSKYIVLNQPCGTSCALYVLLPLIPKKNELTFWNVVYHNLDDEIIITTVDPWLGKFKLSNYQNNTNQEIILNELCPAADKSTCIDSIVLKSDKIFFYYQGSNWKVNYPDNKVKMVNLN
jgi:hypothetical protein